MLNRGYNPCSRLLLTQIFATNAPFKHILKLFWLICLPEDSFSHNLGPKYHSDCLSYVTELYLGVVKSDCLILYQELCFFLNIANIPVTVTVVMSLRCMLNTIFFCNPCARVESH